MFLVAEAVRRSWQSTLLGCCTVLLLDALVIVREHGLSPRAEGWGLIRQPWGPDSPYIRLMYLKRLLQLPSHAQKLVWVGIMVVWLPLYNPPTHLQFSPVFLILCHTFKRGNREPRLKRTERKGKKQLKRKSHMHLTSTKHPFLLVSITVYNDIRSTFVKREGKVACFF